MHVHPHRHSDPSNTNKHTHKHATENGKRRGGDAEGEREGRFQVEESSSGDAWNLCPHLPKSGEAEELQQKLESHGKQEPGQNQIRDNLVDISWSPQI